MHALATLIASIASGEAADAVRRARVAAIAYAIAGLLALVGVLFLLVAAYIAAAMRFGPVATGLAFGFAFLIIAAIIVTVHGVSSKREARRVARRRGTEMKAVASAAAIAALPTLLAGRGKLTLIAPALAVLGYAIYHENRRRSRGDPKP